MRLNDVADVVSDAPSDGQILRYNASNGLWEAGDEPDVTANTIHRSSDGSDHSFIDQSVVVSATPTFGGLTIVNAITEFSTDGTLAGNSDSALPTEKAVKTYADAISAAGMTWTDRGTASSIDRQTGDFTKDGAWYDWDISPIVGSNTALVLLNLQMVCTTANKLAQFRTNGVTGWAVSWHATQDANIYYNCNVWVTTDSSGVFEYNFSSATWSTLDMTVRGWLK